MNRRAKRAVWVAVFLSASAPAAKAYACSASETQVYQSATTVWCVENSVISASGPFPTAYFAYGENVIKELVAVFNVPAQGVYTFEASVPNGSAHTGSECCGLGVTVTGDAFYNDGYGATGFWGYLLSLHETINDWTGQVTSGWPTDFWADHISAFPNSMDWHIMDTLGTLDKDPNLTKAAAAQKARFYPGGDSVDPRVGMFDTIFALPTMGFPGMSNVFSYVQKDKLGWDNLGVPNPDQKRSEYVAAYLSLGARQPVLPTLTAAHVCDGTADGQNDPTYTCNEANIDAIANAHCSIAAAAAQGSNEAADLAALQAGNFGGVTAHGKCGAGCPSECACDTAANHCVAPWLGNALADGGVASDAGAGGEAGAGTDGGGTLGGTDAGGTTSGEGGAGPGGSDGGSGTVSGDGGSGNGDTGNGGGSSSGCGCRTVSEGEEGGERGALLAACGLAAIGIVRSRRTARSRAARRGPHLKRR